MYEPTRDRTNTDRPTHNYNADNRVEEDIYEKLLLFIFILYTIINIVYNSFLIIFLCDY